MNAQQQHRRRTIALAALGGAAYEGVLWVVGETLLPPGHDLLWRGGMVIAAVGIFALALVRILLRATDAD